VINPARPGNAVDFDELSGVAVAYKLAQALLDQENLRRSPSVTSDLRAEELLDLVALGTVADMAPLRGENRTLVRDGLECLNRMERLGIAALCQQTRLKPGQVDAEGIGFILGPRINAAGRVDDATLALDLLLSTDAQQAAHLAQELDRLNGERRQRTAHMQERAREIVLTDGEVPFLLFAADPDFESGIMGLAASRLCDEFYRPAAVVSLGDEVSRGSARSIEEFHITQALDGCSDLLIRYGGHAAAAGFTVANENLQALAEALRARAAEELAACDELRPALVIDVERPLSHMSSDLLQDLRRLEPCGCANPSPLFLSRGVRLLGQRAVGRDGGHLKMTLHDGRIAWDAIAFRQGERAGKLPETVDVAYHLEINEWRGQRSLQLNVQDVRPACVLDGEDAGSL
jgi:single-stranded-DNA-specific exonuclease